MPGPPGVKGEPGNTTEIFCSILQLLFSLVKLTRTIWEGLIRSFCGAKDNFITVLIFTEFTDFSI